ncbi:MAG: hypothetical protein ACLQBK_24325 [Candidatus Sulfotelmatobacter sp.]
MNPNRGTARNANAGKQNDEQGGDGTDRGTGEEIDESLIKAHTEQYGTAESGKRGY